MRQNTQCFYGISNFFKSVKSDHRAKFGNVYFAITGQTLLELFCHKTNVIGYIGHVTWTICLV